jgi:transposase
VRHRHRQGGHGGDDPGAVGQGPVPAGGRDPQLRHHEAGGTRPGGLAPLLAGARRGDGGDYWKGPFYRLEAEGFECVLADARKVNNLPGRPKRDPSDSAWLATCFERGAVTSCFVPTPEFRLIRLHTRYRRDLIDERTREKNRTEKLLESAAVKLPGVVTGLHGVTGRDIMDHLIADERNPKTLAQLARARARRKITELEQALEGAEFFTPAHAALLKAMLDRIDVINAKISRLSRVIEELLAPWEEQLQQAESMPGWGRRSAEDALAETGADMTRFPTPAHLASWAGRTPLDKQSGKRAGQARHKRGNRYLGAITGESAGKTDTREGARYRKLARSRGKANSLRRGRQHPDARLPQAPVHPRRPLRRPRRRLLRQAAEPGTPGQPPRRQARRPRLQGHHRAPRHPDQGADQLTAHRRPAGTPCREADGSAAGC